MIRTLFCLLLICCSGFALAQQKQPDLSQIQQLISATGLERQIYQIPQTLQQTANSPNNPARFFISPVIQALETVFKPEEMLDILSRDLTKRLDVPTLLDAMAWYRSANGQTMLGIEQHISKPETQQRMSKVMLSQHSDVSGARLALLKQMATATQANDIALDMMVNMQAAFMTGLGTMVAPKQKQDFNQVRESFVTTREGMSDRIGQQILLQQTVALETVSDSDINEFLGFANSKSGQKLFQALRASLDYTVRTVATRIPAAMDASKASAAP